MIAPLFPHGSFGTWGACAFVAGLGAAVASDLRDRRIPNVLVCALAAVGLVFSVLAEGFGRGLVASVSGLLLGLVLWSPLFAIGALGAGDVKLFAAAAAWLGPERALIGALLAALAGGLLGLAWLLRSNGVANTAAQMNALVSRRRISVDPKSRHAIPYGLALAAGAIGAAWVPRLVFGG